MTMRRRPVVLPFVLATSITLVAGCEQSSVARIETNGDGTPTTQRALPTLTPEQLAAYKARLSEDQFYVMFKAGTEPPFHNAYHDNHAAGTYVSAATGVPLFSSDDKFDSGTGWPSFVKPINANAVVIRTDADGDRAEVLDASSGGHLGHVFDDGPQDRGGKRYCMNSAALNFVPKGDPLPTTMP